MTQKKPQRKACSLRQGFIRFCFCSPNRAVADGLCFEPALSQVGALFQAFVRPRYVNEACTPPENPGSRITHCSVKTIGDTTNTSGLRVICMLAHFRSFCNVTNLVYFLNVFHAQMQFV